mgnify:FL=1
MIYDNADLYCLRYPFGDDMLVGLLRILAIPDRAMQIKPLISALQCDEISVSFFTQNKKSDFFKEFFTVRPDILMISTDCIEERFFHEITQELYMTAETSAAMPFLIDISTRKDILPEEDHYRYRGFYHIRPPFVPQIQAERLMQFFFTKLLTTDFFRDKIKKCVKLTLSSLYCDSNAAGFDYLTDAVCKVIENPYVRFQFSRDIYPMIAESHSSTVNSVDIQIRSVVSEALTHIDQRDKELCFGEYALEKQNPTIPEFIQSAAALTARPCKKLLRYIEDQPFFEE